MRAENTFAQGAIGREKGHGDADMFTEESMTNHLLATHIAINIPWHYKCHAKLCAQAHQNAILRSLPSVFSTFWPFRICSLENMVAS